MKNLILLNALCALLFTLASPIQAQTYTKITYVHSDADGTPFAATDEQGDIEWQIDHYPYGDEYANTQVVRKSDVSFAGKPYDEEIGLSYFGARWYDPAIGRFTGVDPIPVNPNDYRTFNRYAYGFNNPYKYVDPDGYFPIDYAVDGISISISAGLFANDPSISNGLGLVGDVVLGVLPYVPAGIGLIRAGDKVNDAANIKDAASAANGAKPLKDQATDLISKNTNKNRVTLRSPSQKMEVDLAGKSHGGIPTPHTKVSPRNQNAPNQPAFNTKNSPVRPATQQDIRTVRRSLERQGKE